VRYSLIFDGVDREKPAFYPPTTRRQRTLLVGQYSLIFDGVDREKPAFEPPPTRGTLKFEVTLIISKEKRIVIIPPNNTPKISEYWRYYY
jgi:hypothetical protein